MTDTTARRTRRVPPPPEIRTMVARLAAAERWAGKDAAARRAAMEKAHRARDDRFLNIARERHPDLPEHELQRTAELLRRAHYTRMALASARARKGRKAASRRGEVGAADA